MSYSFSIPVFILSGLLSFALSGYLINYLRSTKALKTKKSQALIKKLFTSLEKCKPAFPDVDFSTIRFVVLKSDDFHMATSRKLPWAKQYIYESISCKNMPIDALIGCIAHELQHIVLLSKSSVITRFLYPIRTAFTNNTKEERAVDRQIVALGFGRQLLAFHKWHNQHFDKYNEGDGLTSKEIKRMLRQMDKH